MAEYIEFLNREEWLKSRINFLGASEIANAMGIGYETPLNLWKEKTGRKEHTDLSANTRVKYGTEAEEHIRALFALQHKDEYAIEYHAFRVYRHDKYSFLTATLDGELTRLADKSKGVWECKTAWLLSKADMQKWGNNSIPQNYYVQVCEQLAVTNYKFAVVTAQLIMPDGNSEIRHYQIERDEIENDIKYTQQEAVKFWAYVMSDKEPPQKLKL